MDKYFYQWELAEESRKYTAFTDAAGRRWQYTVLEMGSPNSVAWVQSHMRAILSVIPEVVPYVDDIPLGDQGGEIPLDWDRKIETIPKNYHLNKCLLRWQSYSKLRMSIVYVSTRRRVFSMRRT